MPNEMDRESNETDSKLLCRKKQTAERAEPTAARITKITNVLQLRHGLPGERASDGKSDCSKKR